MELKMITRNGCLKLLLTAVMSLSLSFPVIASAEITPDMITVISPRMMGNAKPKLVNSVKTGIIKNNQELFETEDLLKENNPILVEFFDYTCGHCKKMAVKLKDYSKQHPDLKIIYKEFPIRGHQARFAAKAALASKNQNRYTEFHSALMDFYGITNHAVIAQAKKVNLDVSKLRKDMKAPEVYQEISDNYALAKEIKITGTPTFVLFTKAKDNKPHIYYINGTLDHNELNHYLYGNGS